MESLKNISKEHRDDIRDILMVQVLLYVCSAPGKLSPREIEDRVATFMKNIPQISARLAMLELIKKGVIVLNSHLKFELCAHY